MVNEVFIQFSSVGLSHQREGSNTLATPLVRRVKDMSESAPRPKHQVEPYVLLQ